MSDRGSGLDLTKVITQFSEAVTNVVDRPRYQTHQILGIILVAVGVIGTICAFPDRAYLSLLFAFLSIVAGVLLLYYSDPTDKEFEDFERRKEEAEAKKKEHEAEEQRHRAEEQRQRARAARTQAEWLEGQPATMKERSREFVFDDPEDSQSSTHDGEQTDSSVDSETEERTKMIESDRHD